MSKCSQTLETLSPSNKKDKKDEEHPPDARHCFASLCAVQTLPQSVFFDYTAVSQSHGSSMPALSMESGIHGNGESVDTIGIDYHAAMLPWVRNGICISIDILLF